MKLSSRFSCRITIFGITTLLTFIICFISYTDACEDCPVGTFADKKGGECKCPLESGRCIAVEACSPCPKGHYNNKIKQSECEACKPGYYASKEGQTECSPCTPGSYASENGSELCIGCPNGTYSTVNASKMCTNCSVGHYQPFTNATSCMPCTEGAYCDRERCSKCSSCDPGKYQNETGSEECLECPAGSYSNKQGAIECIQCGVGHYCNHSDTGCTKCDTCDPGAVPSDDKTDCDLCGIGRYSPGKGAAKCMACVPPHYCSELGCASCDTCPLGQEASFASSCVPCAKGTYRDKNHVICTKCANGYYQPQSGNDSCILCPAGYFCPDHISAPRPCPTHSSSYCPAGSSNPQECGSLFKSNRDQTGCVPEATFYITISLVTLFVVVLILIVGITCYWNIWRHKFPKLEVMPLLPSKKKGKALVYDGF